MTETMNEKQEAQARKESGNARHPIFAASPKPDEKTPTGTMNGHAQMPLVFIESERWFDARAFAVRLFGVPEVAISRIDDYDAARPLLPRWQVRWVGTCGSHAEPLRLQKRKIHDEAEVSAWEDDGVEEPGEYDDEEEDHEPEDAP